MIGANSMILKNVTFIKSAAAPKDFVESALRQVAVAGRSNVGKSSFINFLSGSKNMARVSKEAGRTRLVNYFDADGRFLLVDLPGYGFSKAAKSVREGWAPLIDAYLTTQKGLARILLLVDIRHEPTALDNLMVDFMTRQNIPFSVIATKADKIGKTRIYERLGLIAAALKIGRDNIIPVSNTDKTGADKVSALFAQIMEQPL